MTPEERMAQLHTEIISKVIAVDATTGYASFIAPEGNARIREKDLPTLALARIELVTLPEVLALTTRVCKYVEKLLKEHKSHVKNVMKLLLDEVTAMETSVINGKISDETRADLAYR